MRSVLFAALLMCASAGMARAAADAIPYDDSKAATYEIEAAPLTPQSAPADEYFGRFKISNLGVRNIIHDITIEGNSPLALPKQQARLLSVQMAVSDWAGKYPRDRWLPGAVVRFATVLESKQQPLYDQAAFSLWNFLMSHYPNSSYSKYALGQVRKYSEVANIDVLNVPDVHEVADVIDYPYARIR